MNAAVSGSSGWSAPSRLQRPAAGDHEQHLLAVVAAPLERAPGSKPDHALLEMLASPRRVDRRPHVRRVTGGAHWFDVLLRNDEALYDRHASILATPTRGVNDAG